VSRAAADYPQPADQFLQNRLDHDPLLCAVHGNAEVHVLLRAPFPMVILIGRLTNTLRLVSYEWDDTDPAVGEPCGPRYVPTLRLRASASDGVIQEVLLV
jgi:hypothetical protein